MTKEVVKAGEIVRSQDDMDVERKKLASSDPTPGEATKKKMNILMKMGGFNPPIPGIKKAEEKSETLDSGACEEGPNKKPATMSPIYRRSPGPKRKPPKLENHTKNYPKAPVPLLDKPPPPLSTATETATEKREESTSTSDTSIPNEATNLKAPSNDNPLVVAPPVDIVEASNLEISEEMIVQDNQPDSASSNTIEEKTDISVLETKASDETSKPKQPTLAKGKFLAKGKKGEPTAEGVPKAPPGARKPLSSSSPEPNTKTESVLGDNNVGEVPAPKKGSNKPKLAPAPKDSGPASFKFPLKKSEDENAPVPASFKLPKKSEGDALLGSPKAPKKQSDTLPGSTKGPKKQDDIGPGSLKFPKKKLDDTTQAPGSLKFPKKPADGDSAPSAAKLPKKPIEEEDSTASGAIKFQKKPPDSEVPPPGAYKKKPQKSPPEVPSSSPTEPVEAGDSSLSKDPHQQINAEIARAKEFVKTNEFSKALEIYDEIILKTENLVEAWLGKAEALKCFAMHCYTKAIQIDPKNESANTGKKLLERAFE
eukprot:TRINITY_DN1622_c0_g1_i1.p1 TRINITY_DN1622_c0_g1~~TRINITY_DN1622_c0_g1_i1.p1  ORF type:complete len:538 (+),score=163.21 TRINITY_DN1622_c0_g1_i1:173-1786(+)